jgi:hypothetical protein
VRHPDERTGLRSKLFLALTSAVILGTESYWTRDHILLSRIQDFLFVASYDSQGCGERIRPLLHMGMPLLPSIVPLTTHLLGPSSKHRSQHYFYCYMRIRCRGDVFTEPLQRLYTLQYKAWWVVTNISEEHTDSILMVNVILHKSKT